MGGYSCILPCLSNVSIMVFNKPRSDSAFTSSMYTSPCPRKIWLSTTITPPCSPAPINAGGFCSHVTSIVGNKHPISPRKFLNHSNHRTSRDLLKKLWTDK